MPRFSVWKTNQLWNLLQITLFCLKPVKNPVNWTSQYYRFKEKVCPFGPSRMPTQRHIPFFSSVLPKEQTPKVTQTTRYATNTWNILIKAPCHLSSWHNFSPVDKSAAGWRNKLCHTLLGATHTQKAYRNMLFRQLLRDKKAQKSI